MKQQIGEHAPVPGGMVVVRAILATLAVLLAIATSDFSAFDPYQFCLNCIRLLAEL